MAEASAVKTAANDTNFKKVHPLKSQSFVGITRRLAQYKMSDKAFRLMCFIIGAYGDDGIIFFKREKLAVLIQASTTKLDLAIAELINLGLITTENFKGRGLRFSLTDLCFKNSHVELVEVPRNRGTRLPEINEPHIMDEKKLKKETTTTAISEQPPKKPPKPPGKPRTEKQPKAIDADDILNLRKQLPPEINFRINNIDLSEHLGLSNEHIRWAVSEALKPWVNNPVGMFRSKCRQEMPPSPQLPPKTKPIDKNFNNDKNDLTVKLHDIDFGKYEFEVKKCWSQIKELCKRSRIYFYVRIDSQAAMQRGISAITILNALNNTIDNWDNVNDNPKAYFEAQCGMKWG